MMRRRPRALVESTRAVVLPVVLLLVVVSGGDEARAEDLGKKAREAFVKTRNTCDLVDALEGLPARDPYTATDAQLALAACDRVVSPAETTERGYAALPAVIGALKKLDLEAASAAADRVGDTVAGGVGVWARALILARQGRDTESIAALHALPALPEADRERASFALALFGAALPQDDRLLLGAMGRAALFSACRTGDHAHIVRLSRSLAALDREVGTHSLCLAFRALRRLARHQEADHLVVAPEVAGHLDAHSCYLLERALALWRSGEPERARAIAVKLSAAAPNLFVVEALRTPTTAIQAPASQPAPVHVAAADRVPAILARFATLLGVPTRAAEVRAAAQTAGARVDDPTFAKSWLESRGCQVAFAAGSGRAGEAALARDLPFLFYEIRLEGQTFVDLPAIVRSRDSENGLWLLEDLDLYRPDVRPADAARKAWFLLAAGPGAPEAPEAWIDRRDQLLGRVIVKGLGHAAAGDLASASAYLQSQAVNVGGPAVFDLYRAFLYYSRYASLQDVAPLQHAFEAVSRTVKTSPRLCFELVAQGQGLFAFEHDVEGALTAFDEAQRLAPHSAWLARTRWLLLATAGELSRALDALELARVLDPTDTDALYLRGHRRALGGDVPGARGDLRRAFDRDPTSHEIALELARLENSRRDGKAALGVILTYLEHVPEAATDDDVVQARFVAESRLVQGATSIDDLRALVDSPLEETRRRVVYALARLENADALALLRGLLEDSHAAVRGTALKVYMRPWLRSEVQRDESLGAMVARLLQDDESEVVRGAAAGLLGLIAEPYAVKALVAALGGDAADRAPYPRSEAARALGRQGGADANAALVAGLADPDPDVRTVVIETLYKIAGTYHGYEPRGPEEERLRAIERWRRWLGEPDSRENGSGSREK